MLRLLVAACLAGGSFAFAALDGAIQPEKLSEKSPWLVSLLKAELEREFPVLQQKSDPRPYYMAYEVSDEASDVIVASDGALVGNTHGRVRGLDTMVRVGSAQFDNYHPLQGTRFNFTGFRQLSLDNDAAQIRRAVWSETNRVYTAGAQRLLQLKADQQVLAQERAPDPDFSSAPATTFTSVPEEIPVNTEQWAASTRQWSAVFRSHPSIIGSQVIFRRQHNVRTYVDTEGSQIQTGSNLVRIEAAANGIASDGMEVGTFTSIEATDAAHVPAEQIVSDKIQHLAEQVDALIKAPPAEPIYCPAILSGRAAAVFFHEIFGHRVEGHRQKDTGEGQTFTHMIGQKVLPEFISVTFDPTLRQINGADLIGHYDYDDEGVKGQVVHAVEAGVLKTFLLSRSPVQQFTHSNGHGRRQPGFEPESRQSSLIVESTKQVSDAQLRAMLIDEIKRQNKAYGLYFEEVASGYTTTQRQGLQAFTVVPLVVYRVYADGRPDELIRGVDIVGTPLASFQKILATSDHVSVFNGYCGAESGSIPVSAVAPAILISEIETQKKRNQERKPPVLARPEENK